jgi:hypothetical protein
MIMNSAGYGRGRRALDMRMKADIPDLIPRGGGAIRRPAPAPHGGGSALRGRLAILSRTAIRNNPWELGQPKRQTFRVSDLARQNGALGADT